MTYPSPVNLTDPGLLLNYANNVSDGYLGVGLLVSLYSIVFLYLVMKRDHPADCLTVAGWITLVPGIFFFLLGLLSNAQLFIVIALFLIPLMWSYFSKER